jgi:hypothetical protein
MRPVRALAVVVTVLSVTACDATPLGTPTASPTVVVASASVVGGGCGTTSVYQGALPAWAESAQVPDPSRYVMSHEGDLVGVLFVSPLVAPARTQGPNNKILWISSVPRDGSTLTLTLAPLAGGTAVTVTQPADSEPGEIYPSIVDVPASGCWSVVAEWAGHRATLELPYEKA